MLRDGGMVTASAMLLVGRLYKTKSAGSGTRIVSGTWKTNVPIQGVPKVSCSFLVQTSHRAFNDNPLEMLAERPSHIAWGAVSQFLPLLLLQSTKSTLDIFLLFSSKRDPQGNEGLAA